MIMNITTFSTFRIIKMSEENVLSKLLKQHKSGGEKYQSRPFFSEFGSFGLELPHTLILTCVDPRISPEKFLDLGAVGPLIFRNVCGHVAPALLDIVSLDSLLKFEEILIIHHTDCGSLMIKDENIRDYIKQELPEVKDVDSLKFGGIVDVAQSVKDDLAILRASPLIRTELHKNSYGAVLDIKTGEFTPV